MGNIEAADEKAHPKIFSIKTQVGKEQNTADLLLNRADKLKISFPAILSTPELRGYIFVEGYNKERLKDIIKTRVPDFAENLSNRGIENLLYIYKNAIVKLDSIIDDLTKNSYK